VGTDERQTTLMSGRGVLLMRRALPTTITDTAPSDPPSSNSHTHSDHVRTAVAE
jgi:hypothetical protein